MGEFRPPLRSDFGRNDGKKWVECHLCGPKDYAALVHFTSGSVAPTADTLNTTTRAWTGGETVTGATSGDTGVIRKVVKTSGTYAGGDAAGILILRSPTGYDDGNLEIFTASENLNGSTSGNNFATVNKTGAVSVSGRLAPDDEIIEYEGKNYCKAHFRFKFEHDWADEAKIDRDEGDRE